MMNIAQRKSINYSRFEAVDLSFLVCCLLLLSIPLHSFASPVPATEEELCQLCRSTCAEGKFADASQHIEKFLSLYPESERASEIFFMQAFLQLAIDTSAKMYGLIIEKYPKSDSSMVAPK